MSSALDNAPVVDDEDEIGPLDGGEPVCDDDRSPAGAQLLKGLLDLGLGGRVNGRGGLVQEDDLRVSQDDAGDGDSLQLAAREFDPALSDLGRVSVGESHDLVVDGGGLAGLVHLLVGGVQSSVSNILQDRLVEERRILRHEAEGLSEAAERDFSDVLSVNSDATSGDVVEAEEEPQDRCVERKRGSTFGVPSDEPPLGGCGGRGRREVDKGSRGRDGGKNLLDLPQPVSPTSATVLPGSATKPTSSRTVLRAS